MSIQNTDDTKSLIYNFKFIFLKKMPLFNLTIVDYL